MTGAAGSAASTAEAWKVKTENGYRRSIRIIHCFVGKADGAKLTEPLLKS